MANIEGILVELATQSGAYSGTDDEIYLGVFGKKGGSEFPLFIEEYDDYQSGKTTFYWIGEVWDGDVLDDARRIISGKPGQRNDPALRYIDLESVDYVYLRKAHYEPDDDAWTMNYVVVTLYGPRPTRREFKKTGDIELGREYGLQVWLKEQ